MSSQRKKETRGGVILVVESNPAKADQKMLKVLRRP